MAHAPGSRNWILASVLLAGLSLGACSSGATSSPAPGPPATSPAPAANIDPNSKGLITGPINKARNTANQLNGQQNQVQPQTGGG